MAQRLKSRNILFQNIKEQTPLFLLLRGAKVTKKIKNMQTNSIVLYKNIFLLPDYEFNVKTVKKILLAYNSSGLQVRIIFLTCFR
jgi:hypothetical protein